VTPFAYADGTLHAEQVPLATIAARFGTPCYVYSRMAIEAAFRDYDGALAGLPHLVCYAAKANGNLAVLDILARLGCGFDIVSGGELARVIAAGGDPARTVFSGVGKTDAELQAALAAGILCFNVESEGELHRLARVAQAAGRRAPISLRVNPDVDARTHPYISTGLRENKFGVPIEAAESLYRAAAALPSLAPVGVDMHIGSQVTELAPFRDAAQRVLALVDRLARHGIVLDRARVARPAGAC
jgi:diaminopimelate decarboxylase